MAPDPGRGGAGVRSIAVAHLAQVGRLLKIALQTLTDGSANGGFGRSADQAQQTVNVGYLL